MFFRDLSTQSLRSPIFSIASFTFSLCLKSPLYPSALGCYWSQTLLTSFNSAPTRQIFWMATSNSTKNASPCGSGPLFPHHSFKIRGYECFSILLGYGTAKIPSPVPPLARGEDRRKKQAFSFFQHLQFANDLSKVSAAKCDWTKLDIADRSTMFSDTHSTTLHIFHLPVVGGR